MPRTPDIERPRIAIVNAARRGFAAGYITGDTRLTAATRAVVRDVYGPEAAGAMQSGIEHRLRHQVRRELKEVRRVI